MRFVVKRARRGRLRRNQWRWVLLAANGEVIATSETYANRSDVLATIDLIRTRVADAIVVAER